MNQRPGNLYVDTSVLVAYYAPEPLSELADSLLAGTRPALSGLVEVEMLSALARKVRLGQLHSDDAAKIRGRFAQHLQAGRYRRLFLDAQVYRWAAGWLSQEQPPLRTLDALHLGAAARWGLVLASADRQLVRAARSLGLEVLPVSTEMDPAALSHGDTATDQQP